MLNPMTDALTADLAALLPPGTMREVTPTYLEEPRGRWRGQAGCVVAPADTEQVAAVVRFAAAQRVGIVPWSGGTGLVGGQLMSEGPDAGPVPILLTLERMNRVRAIYPEENVILAEAGVILAEVQRVADEAGRLFPLSLASEGSCRIGGNLSTNAGGVNVLRYGNARELCLGVEAVLPDGSILNGARRLRKDNTGYDLRHLLIGAEGTLGVITAASLRLSPRPARMGAALIVVRDPAAALSLLALAQDVAGGAVSAFELISGMGLRFLAESGLAPRAPFAEIPDWMVLIDLGLTAAQDPADLLETIFAEAAERELVSDGVIASSLAQRDAFWAIRETIPAANKKVGAILSNDISLPLSAIPGFVTAMAQKIAALGDFRINAFGHLGDGNLHYNVFPPKGRDRAEYAAQAERLRMLINDEVAALDGSFSAEHGIGRLKVADLERYGDPAKLAAMRAIKAALDPLGIMNPGAVLRG
ncbi:FAD-binding oxidoreductase [Oceaniovalibus sp. ACAM 378]|uniref:FAD-binding oxidoreductase n=1 Tax=Oceaniovalibus sp. ACAM 378 TaxID=2599923 RepID=UPI0011D93A51|nr:FAD-binding oxidoreductase [Oceaniovalibus sp. ACAM 378]TYB87578.1 FAD-binding oxidoreductase [Oceaniovalibus sp. ACAM 378]